MQPILIPCPRCGSKLKLRDTTLLGKQGKCPHCQNRFELSAAAAALTNSPEPVSDTTRDSQPMVSTPGDESIESLLTSEASGIDRWVERRRRERERGRWLIWLLAAIGVASVATIFTVVNFRNAPLQNEPPDQAPASVVQAPRPTLAPSEDSPAEPAASIPSGPPIDLRYVPHGVAFVINFHPADLWGEGNRKSQMPACFGERFVDWLNTAVKSRCLFERHQLAEVKICLYFAAPGQPVQVAGVVTLAEPVKHSEMFKRVGGTRRDDLGLPYYVGEAVSYLLIDEQTFAFCPTSMVEDWKVTIDSPATTKESIFRVLQSSDRSDQLTLIFEPADVRLHCESLVPNSVIVFVRTIVDWFDDDVETVLWGLRMDRSFRSRVLVRSRTTFDQARMERTIAENLQQAPQRILERVHKMHPGELGTKRVVGRFPAMSLACQRATRISREEGQLQLETRLPLIAAPNLVLASRLFWQESIREESAVDAVTAGGGATPQPPESITQRLSKPIDCDFRRTPLHEAVALIGEEIGVEIELAGEDLKLIGVTQNMPQEFKMEQESASAILHHMLTKIGLVIVVNELQNKIVVTSAAAAKARGESPFPLSDTKESNSR